MTSFSKTKHPILRDGRGQLERRLPALSPGSIELDGAALPEKLDFLLRLSRQVNYYDSQLRRSDWTAFFQQEIPFQIARISRFDPEASAARFQELKTAFQDHPTPEQLGLMMDFQLDLFSQIERWRAGLPDDTGMGRFINSLIESNLRFALRQFISLSNAASGQWSYSPSRNLFDFQQPWQLSVSDFLGVEPSVSQQKSADRYRLDFAASRLEELSAISLKSLREIVAQAPRLLRESLDAHQTHEPHVGLMYAFLEMLGDRKAGLEKLTALHLDFFYREVLGIGLEKAVPDQAHLVFQLAKNFKQEPVPKGALFKSGLKDSQGLDIFYRLEKEVIVDHASVVSLRTLFLDLAVRKQKAGREKPSNLVKGIYMAPQANSMDGLGEAFQSVPASWETLGEKESKKPLLAPDGTVTGKAPHPFANLGMLLAGDVFLAKEGTRTVTIKFRCNIQPLKEEFNINSSLQIGFGLPSDSASFPAFFNAFSSAVTTRFALTEKTQKSLVEAGHFITIIETHLNDWRTGKTNFETGILQTSSSLGLNYSTDQQKLLLKYADRRQVFKVYFTGEKEWVSPAEVVISLEPATKLDATNTVVNDPDHFLFVAKIELDPGQPAVLPFNAAAHLTPAGVTEPAWKLLFNHEFPPAEQVLPDPNPLPDGVSFYHFFRFLTVSAIDVTVDVKDLKGVILQNEVGVLDVKKPFQPWGAAPKVNAEFFIGSQELFQKDLKKLYFEMAWQGVPASFASHYKGYRRPSRIPGKDKYSAGISLLQDAVWKSKFPKEPLFDSDNTGKEKFMVDFGLSANAPLKGRKIPGALTAHDANSTNGFLRLVLNEPDLAPPSDLLQQSAFFHSEYPGALARQMMAQSIVIQGAIRYDGSDFKLLSEIILNEIKPVLNALVSSFTENFTDINDSDNWPNAGTSTLVNNIEDNFEAINNETNLIIQYIQDPASGPAPPPPLDEVIESKTDTVWTNINQLSSRLASFAGLASGPAVPAANNLKSAAEAFQILFGSFEIFFDKYIAGELEVPIPIEPYTPTAKDLSIDYCAQANQNQLSFYHFHPYEATYLHHDWSKGNPTLLPYFKDQGTLYIGLKNLTPGGGLNLLFQLAESTANADGDRACIQWSYLVGNEWKTLRPGFHILGDATDGLLADGIVEFSIPWDADTKHTILPDGLFWLKAAATERADAVSETLGVFAQAGLVAFAADLGTDGAHLAKPLAAEQIAKPAENIAFLQGIQQPFPSFGGRLKEADSDYHRRVSERLRHKGRAITLFDWETLVLHHFPEVFKVKCITHTLGKRVKINDKPQDIHQAPGFVTLAVIPDLTGLPASDLLEPKLSLATLEKIEEIIKERCSPFVRVRALNPAYEPVRVSANVQLQQGRNKDFYLNQLKKDLLGFLSPWTSTGESSRLQFGGTVFRSVLLDFVESREYVDFVTEFKMIDAANQDREEIAAESARSILISGKHEFVAKGCEDIKVNRPPNTKIVGYAALESTFQIG